MQRVRCDKCGESADGPGSVVLRVLQSQLPMRRARVDLCKCCWAELDRWLTPRPAEPVAIDDDDQADDD